jgi:acetyl esterase/lipase
MDLTQLIPYGDHPDQFFRLRFPANQNQDAGKDYKIPLCVIIHGGFWKQKYGIDSAAIESLAPFFISKGWATCEVEYRRIADEEDDSGGGGWPNSNHDCFAAMLKLWEHIEMCKTKQLESNAAAAAVDFSRVVILGHSAGGQLALWLCSSGAEMEAVVAGRSLTSAKLPFRPALCVALAPVADLVDAAQRRLSDSGDAVQRYVGAAMGVGPDSKASRPEPWEVPALYALSSPLHLGVAECPSLWVTGVADTDVPADYVQACHSRAKALADAARAPSAHLLSLEDCDHYRMVDATSTSWQAIYTHFGTIVKLPSTRN